MKQAQGVQFFRQRPIGNYIVDFFAPKARLIVEVDGAQHMTDRMARRDKQRDDYLTHLGLLVLRFPDSKVLRETEGVMEEIFRRISERCTPKSPPTPLQERGGKRFAKMVATDSPPFLKGGQGGFLRELGLGMHNQRAAKKFPFSGYGKDAKIP